MYFLNTIAGCKGENLTTAVFKYLLMNSSAVRSLFVQSLAGKLPPSAVPTFKNGIVCDIEVDTGVSDDGRKSGRIDLIVQGDNCLIGVENKLWAEVQGDQPGKYIPFLEDRVTKCSAARGITDLALVIVILAPREREREIDREIHAQKIAHPVFVMYWQEVCKQLKQIKNDSNENQLVTSFLTEYLEDNLGPLKIPKEEVLGGNVRIGNQFQRDLLAKIQNLIQNCVDFSARRLAPGIKGGYYGFGVDYHDGQQTHQNWIGFVDLDGSVILCFQTGLPLTPTAEDKLVPMKPMWTGEFFQFQVDSEWPETMAQWRDFLNPTLKLVEETAGSLPAKTGSSTP